MPGSLPARKVMRRESLFGDCQACSLIVREISRLFTDHLTGDGEYLPRYGPSESVTVATKTMPGEVQHDDDQHNHTYHGVEDLDSYGSLLVRFLLYFTPLLLFASPIARETPWF